MPKTKGLTNISRIDQDSKTLGKAGQHGWWVRLQRAGNKHHHFFTDNKYGGKEDALAAATIFRDALKSQYIENAHTEITLTGQRKKNLRNKSGVSGVNRSSSTNLRNGKRYRYFIWQAHWPAENGTTKTKSFSINKNGEEGAFQLALQARKQGIANYKRAKHPSLIPPEDEKQKIWRYMDFTKFISMLEEKALFFSTIANLNDPFEGSLSKLNVSLRPLINKNKEPLNIKEQMNTLRNEVGVNCWHINNYESAAMWEIYSKTDESVCIQSTYHKLKEAISGTAEIGIVQYVDYKDEYIPEYNPYLAFLYKRKSFEFEQELRAILHILSGGHKNGGIFVKTDLDYLIDNIYVSPNAPKWFSILINKTVKRYKLAKRITQSSLSDDPVY